MVLVDVRRNVQGERMGRSLSNVYNYTGVIWESGCGYKFGGQFRHGDHAEASFLFWPGHRLEQMHISRMTKMAIKPPAHAQEAVDQLSGGSTKTAINGSKKFCSMLSKSPEESSKKPPSGIIESEQASEVSDVSKHSHLGRTVPFPSTLA